MTISVDVEVARHPGVLIVPAAALRGGSTDKPWVLKINGTHAQRQNVKTGIVSAGRAEILDGLKEGELVVPANAAIKDGARIRPQILAQSAP